MKAKLITIDRQLSSSDEPDEKGWHCWIRVWNDDNPIEGGIPVVEHTERLKQDAVEWAIKNYPGVKVSYVTDCTRKPKNTAAIPINDAIDIAAHPEKLCTKCGNYCPCGTLDNGLCNDCALIGKKVYVSNWSTGDCIVTRVGKRGTVYAKRLYVTGGCSKERPIHYYKGWKV